MIQLGGYIDNSNGYPQLGYVSSTVAQEKILKGKWGIPVYPILVPIDSLNNLKHQNVLIELDDVEFACADVFQPYADVPNLGSLNRIVKGVWQYNYSANKRLCTIWRRKSTCRKIESVWCIYRIQIGKYMDKTIVDS